MYQCIDIYWHFRRGTVVALMEQMEALNPRLEDSNKDKRKKQETDAVINTSFNQEWTVIQWPLSSLLMPLAVDALGGRERERERFSHLCRSHVFQFPISFGSSLLFCHVPLVEGKGYWVSTEGQLEFPILITYPMVGMP